MRCKMKYRLLYKKETGCAVPTDYDIHHIDMNKTNNTINNLVAIPHKLHEEYHDLYKECNKGVMIPTPQNPISLFGGGVLSYEKNRAQHLLSLLDCIEKINEYIYYRDSLLGTNIINGLYKEVGYAEGLYNG